MKKKVNKWNKRINYNSIIYDYREQANRDRFVLPEHSDVNMFIDTINNALTS